MDDGMESRKKISQNMGQIKNKIAVMSGKGGVGKTTVAVNIAAGLSSRGYKVGILDVDIHGPNVPKMLGIDNKYKLQSDGKRIIPYVLDNGLKAMSMAFLLETPDSPVIWRGPMKISVINQFLGDVDWGQLDYLIVDLPPGTGDESLSIAQMISGAGAIIVTTPQDVALLDSSKSVRFAQQLGISIIGIVENMSGLACPHCGKGIDLFKAGGGEKASKDMDIPFLGRVPIDPMVVESGDSGSPVITHDSATKTNHAFSNIIDEIEKSRRK